MHTPRVLALIVHLAALVGLARAQDFSAPGPYSVGTATVTVTRPNASTFTARLAYPATTPGAATPFAQAASPAPGIAFGHGFFQSTAQYASTMDHLASWGFIVIASNSETSLFPSHANFAADLRHTLTYLEQQNALAGAPLFAHVDVARFGMSGHSMGGGASILATADDARVKALANLAAAETTPSAISAMARITVPTSLIAGDSDTIVPIGSHGQLMYNAGSAPQLLPVIRGGFHCGFTDASFFGCDSSATLTRPQQLAIARRLLAQFFLLTLKDRQDLWSSVWGPSARADAQVIFTQSAPGATITPTLATISGAPSASNEVTINITNTDNTARSFAFLAEAAQSGAPSVSFEPTTTVTLAPGASQGIAARATFGAQPFTGAIDVLLTARSQNDGSTRAFATLRCTSACLADFNADGGVDGDDVIAFFISWDSNDARADVNTDGGIDGDDVIAFFTRWDAGC